MSLIPPTNEGPPPSPASAPPARVHLPEAELASTPLDRAQMLAEVMDYVIKVSKPTPLVLPRPRVWIPLLTLASFIFALYSWAVKPAWIWGPQVDPDVVAATHDPDMRFAMFLLAQQILKYREEFGVVPATLSQVGARMDSVKYVPLTDTSFSLRYESDHPIIYYSTGSTDEFLRNALDVVRSSTPSKTP
ncbi:MAG TPA: hypothetical protein VNE60_04345 [Gemmatimonadaceae bacterium]|nr:hypothetical protein [Gemmatimonadaceae bacterium]